MSETTTVKNISLVLLAEHTVAVRAAYADEFATMDDFTPAHARAFGRALIAKADEAEAAEKTLKGLGVAEDVQKVVPPEPEDSYPKAVPFAECPVLDYEDFYETDGIAEKLHKAGHTPDLTKLIMVPQGRPAPFWDSKWTAVSHERVWTTDDQGAGRWVPGALEWLRAEAKRRGVEV